MKGFVELTHLYYADGKHKVVADEKITYNVSAIRLILSNPLKDDLLDEYANTIIFFNGNYCPLKEKYDEVLRKIELASN